MSIDKIDSFSKLGKIDGDQLKSIQDIMEQRLSARISPDNVNFEALMQRVDSKEVKVALDTGNKVENLDHSSKYPSVMEEVSKLGGTIGSRKEHLSANKIVARSEEAMKSITQLQNNLGTPNLRLRESTQRMMGSKLTNINDSLKIVADKIGLENSAALPSVKLAAPVKNFLDMLTYSQRSLAQIGQRAEMMAKDPNSSLSPGAMLTIQIKMHTITQEMEFFTSLLSKSIESTKTIMNVQI